MHESLTVLDTIVQGSAVDLFHSCNIAVAPIDRCLVRPEQIQHQELSAMISFAARKFTGTLTLGMPQQVFSLVKQDPARPYDSRDWVRETLNQLCGRIKGRLLQFQVSLQVGLPTSLTREAFDRQKNQGGFFAAYAFRTLRGSLLVTLVGNIDPAVFAYTNTAPAASEGDIILF